MTDARAELRERVARALNARCFDGCEDGEAGFRACVDPPCPCRKAADAAIAIVLEEAAKVAENPPKVWIGNTYQWQMPKHPWLPHEIAAAIRALKSGQ